jgi:hypothetical protein
MGGHHEEERKPAAAEAAPPRRTRLSQELRANLMRRKAQIQARKSKETPRDKGGQSQA